SIVRDVFWPIFGVSVKRDPFSATETAHAMFRVLSATNSIPVFFDEYKPRDMGSLKKDAFHRILRRVYGGETEERGRADLSLVSYSLQAPVVFAGETRPEGDEALLERILCVSPNKNALAHGTIHRQAFAKLQTIDIAKLGSHLVQ